VHDWDTVHGVELHHCTISDGGSVDITEIGKRYSPRLDLLFSGLSRFKKEIEKILIMETKLKSELVYRCYVVKLLKNILSYQKLLSNSAKLLLMSLLNDILIVSSFCLT
jgi:hypothetical protein